MRAIVSLALKDLIKKRGLMLMMALLFGLAFGCFYAIQCYEKNLQKTYGQLSQEWLVVQQSSGVGEIHGSRLSSDVGEKLAKMGYDHPIPEIHQVVGTSYASGMLMRGVSLEDYSDVTRFSILSGRALTSGDAPRLAMVGKTLAEIQKVKVGEKLRVRGRDFEVIGVFQTDTYQDNEVWISLTDAQNLLNYGDDVSIYILPEGGELTEGVDLGDGISVGRKGESGNLFGHEISSFYGFLGMVSAFAGVAAIITLANLLWRLAWLNRHEFGIIRTLGFGSRALLVYLFIQGFSILFIGLVVGLVLANTVIFTKANQLTAFGLGVDPNQNFLTILYSVGVAILVLLVGIALPALKIHRTTIPTLLGRE